MVSGMVEWGRRVRRGQRRCVAVAVGDGQHAVGHLCVEGVWRGGMARHVGGRRGVRGRVAEHSPGAIRPHLDGVVPGVLR
jgi:hypothetical protein